MIDVTDYGFSRDGRPIPPEAIAEVCSRLVAGGQLYFPAGTYVLSDTLAFANASGAIRGDGI